MMELIQARSKIKQFIKHMPVGTDRAYLMKLQKELKAYVNNCKSFELKVYCAYDSPDSDVSVWSVNQIDFDYDITVVVKYLKKLKLYEFSFKYATGVNIFVWIESDEIEDIRSIEMENLIKKAYLENFVPHEKD